MEMKTKLIILAILLVIMLIGYIGHKITLTKHREDPEFQRKQEERAAEYRRRMQEEDELNDIALSMNGDSYDDEEE